LLTLVWVRRVRPQGFEGLVVSDYNAVNQLGRPFASAFASAVNAGVDMVMTSSTTILGEMSHDAQLDAAEQAVAAGQVAQERIDDAVRRIVRVKVKLGLVRGTRAAAEAPPAPSFDLDQCVGCDAHRATARRAAAASAVLLKHGRGALPLGTGDGLVVTGSGADNLGMQCGGWTSTWQGQHGNTFTSGGTTIWSALRKVRPNANLVSPSKFRLPRSLMGSPLATATDVVVVVGEGPYAEGGGDTHLASLSSKDASLVDAVADGIRRITVVILSGRPIVLPPSVLQKADAIVAAWTPGTEGDGVADVLCGEVPFTGRLSFSWPRDVSQMVKADRVKDPLYPLGHGLALDASSSGAAGAAAEPTPELF
jgi:beta-glucosidase